MDNEKNIFDENLTEEEAKSLIRFMSNKISIASSLYEGNKITAKDALKRIKKCYKILNGHKKSIKRLSEENLEIAFENEFDME